MELEVDGERLFESFTNFVQLNPCTSFCAFLFGHRDEQRVIVTFFAKVTIEISIEKQIFFLNDALLSDMELLGVLCVDDVENIDEEFLQDVAGGSVIQLKTSYEALLAKDFEAIRAELNGERVTLRNERYTNESDDNCIIATTSISVTLEFQTRQNLNSDLEEQFARIAHRVERLSFLTKDQGLYLGEETESDALVEYLKVNKYDKVGGFVNTIRVDLKKTFLPLTAVEDLTSDDGDGDESMLVPVVHLRNKLYSAYHRLTFTVQAWAKLRPSDSTECILRFLRLSLLRQLNAAHLSITKYSTAKKFVLSEGRLFFPSDFPVRLVVRYPQLDDENQYEDFRDFLHSTFNLAKNRPIFRPVMSIANGNSTNLLRNPHLAITTYKPLGRLSLVKGSYDYHHYMQDGMDDNGWGCAYRSLQTIWSWFRLQGYTEKAVPTHRQIQQVLVDIGDREANFVGSRQWIGSLELSYVLENMLGISSRIVTSNSGPEVVEKGRQLAMHFDQQGSPVMIGGGMLAHTILGVDFDEDSGECRFLVLDPHYTGEEDQKIVLNKGWCAWKPASFWSRGDFYNMLLPMPPMDVF